MSGLGVIYPGQGAQFAGMGRELAEGLPSCRKLFDRASEVLGFDLARLCFEGSVEELTKSCNAQPAIFAVSAAARLAVAELAGRPDWKPAFAAGLSSGEWAALWEAGVVSFEDALRILRARGTYMQEACDATPGGMVTVIGLPVERVAEVARETGLDVANCNSPLQTVLSGRAELLDDAVAAAKAAGAKRALKLNVAGAFHCPLMKPAAEKLAAFLETVDFRDPAIPVWSNVTAAPHGDAASIRDLMVRQVWQGVRWSESFAGMADRGMEAALECGPGTVLAGLAKRIAPSVAVAGVSSLTEAREAAKLIATQTGE